MRTYSLFREEEGDVRFSKYALEDPGIEPGTFGSVN